MGAKGIWWWEDVFMPSCALQPLLMSVGIIGSRVSSWDIDINISYFYCGLYKIYKLSVVAVFIVWEV